MNEERSPAPPLPPVDPRRADRLPPDVVTPEMLAGLLVEGDHDLVTWALQVALGGRSREDVYDTLIRDAMRLVGEGWHAGRWTVSEEHRATQTLVRALDDVAPETSPTDRIGPTAVLATVEGEQHAIGLDPARAPAARGRLVGGVPWPERPGRRPGAVRGAGEDARWSP